MHDNKIRDAGARALGLALSENTGLRFLSLSSNGVSNDGAVGLAEGLRANSNLRRLDLYFNQVSDVGAEALASALKTNDALRQLHIDNNYVHDAGGKALGEALASSRGLTELTLMYNQIKNDGARLLLNAAMQNEGVEKLSISHNDMVHGAVKQEAATFVSTDLAERRKLAQWLRDTGLAGETERALLTAYAAPARELRAHHADGLLALNGIDQEALKSHAALAALSAEQATAFAAVLHQQVQQSAQHDEL